MSRLWAVFRCDFVSSLKGAFFWIWYALLAANAILLTTGNWIIRSVDTSVGTQKSFVNSEFQIAFAFALMPFLMLGIFMAISAGSTILRDTQWRVGEIIHTTPLRPAEYVWGKFLAVLASALAVIGLFVLTLFFLNEVVPHPGSEIHGPAHLGNYIFPAIAFMVPAVLFLASVSFFVSIFTRRAALVYLFPVFMLVLAMNFLYYWYPPDFTPLQNYLMQCADPSGFRWLKQTWFKVDRGVGYYNTNGIHYDPAFVAGRLLYVALAAGLVGLSSRRFARRFARIADDGRSRKIADAAAAPASGTTAAALPAASRVPSGRLRQIARVAFFELKEQASQPWLFVFIALISIVTLVSDRTGAGDLHIQQLFTTGLTTTFTFAPVSLMVCFLLLFTTGESLAREETSGLVQLYYSTPVATSSLVLGKSAASFAVAVFAVLVNAACIAAFVLLHHEAPLEWRPFLYIYVYLMLPTFVFWTAFSAAAYSFSRSRFGTYGAGIVVIAATFWMIANDRFNWVTHWSLATSLVWSDFGVFEIDRAALILNRLFYLSLGASLLAVAIRFFPRRTSDARFVRSAEKRPLLRRVASLALLIVLPASLGVALWLQVEDGFEGSGARRMEKDYWRQNVATYWRAPLPDRTFVDLDLRFEPEQRAVTVRGVYKLINNNQEPLYRFPVTGMGQWEQLAWTFNGKAAHPENRSGLFVFPLDPPLQPQETATLGFSYEARILPGVSRHGGPLNLGEFVLPSGIVLTGRNPWFVPVIGFMENVGIDDDNRHEPEDPDPHFYQNVITSGVDRSLMDTRVRIDVPDKFLVTSMGVETSETVSNGRRVALWESDYPVRVFNVVAGHWLVRNGKESTVYYRAGHTENLEAIAEALDGARHYYSQWFGAYPWKQLRLSEFPGIALYARGNPTNIFFSENIGFLTRDNMKDTISFGLSSFGVTAHEAAHQWWGHMVSPGDAPGGIVLAEGMANFSVMCLLEQMQGKEAREAFSRSLELYYGENRAVTSERPLARTTNYRPADSTVIYDKGSWVFWMMRNVLGKDAMNAGLASFIAKYQRGLDRPVSEDFIAHMRGYAQDPALFDRFTEQWFFEVAIPEYRYMTKPEKRQTSGGWEVRALLKNVGTGRMPVEVAAARDDGSARKSVVVTLGAGEETDIVISCNFDPERLVVDPDVQVLQLQRNAGMFRFR